MEPLMSVKEFNSILCTYINDDNYLFYFELNGQLLSINSVDVDCDGNVLLFANSYNGRKSDSLTVKELIKKISKHSDDTIVYYSTDSSGDIRADLSIYTDPDQYDILPKTVLFKIPILEKW